MGQIEQIFQYLLSQAGTSTLSKKDFRSGLQVMLADRTINLPSDLRQILHADRIVEVCDYLDSDRSGEIDQSEFIDGIFSLMLQSVPTRLPRCCSCCAQIMISCE